jgi:hypothetical protein
MNSSELKKLALEASRSIDIAAAEKAYSETELVEQEAQRVWLEARKDRDAASTAAASARSLVVKLKDRKAAAEALARLMATPDLLSVVLGWREPSADEAQALQRRNLMVRAPGLRVHTGPLVLSNLAKSVASLCREIEKENGSEIELDQA